MKPYYHGILDIDILISTFIIIARHYDPCDKILFPLQRDLPPLIFKASEQHQRNFLKKFYSYSNFTIKTFF